LTGIPNCQWDCTSANCPPGTVFDNDCYSVSGQVVCPDGYDFTNSAIYGPACCPTPTPMPPDQSGDGGGMGSCNPAFYQECLNVDGARWNEPTCQCLGYPSPVLVDTAGDGFRLTGASDGVRFDLDSDGVPERVAWTPAASDDAWLALDRDGDGAITNGRELFGDFTPQPAPPPGRERNGFLALAEFDRTARGGNSDGAVDARDAVFAHLRLWRDTNRDGVSQASELYTLPALGLTRLHLDYKESKRVDGHGNEFRYRAKVDDSKGAKVNRRAWDVFLVSAP
jgi:hypothetical protein